MRNYWSGAVPEESIIEQGYIYCPYIPLTKPPLKYKELKARWTVEAQQDLRAWDNIQMTFEILGAKHEELLAKRNY